MTKLTKSEILVSLAFFLLTLGQLVNFKLYGLASTSFYLFDVYLIACGLVSILYLVSNYNHVIITRVTFLFLFFTLIASFSLVSNNVVNTYAELAFQAFYLIRWVSYFTTAVVIGHLIRVRLLSVRYIYKLSVLSAVFLVLTGFLQLYLLPDFTVLDPIFGWDPHKGRLASTFFDPNFVAAYIVVALTICLGLFYYQNYTVFSKKTLGGMFVLLCIGLLLTFSRSGWGMFVIVMSIFGVLKYRLLLVYSAVLALLAYVAVPRVQTRLAGITDPSDSAHYRLISWTNALEVYKSSPVIGVGFNAYREVQKDLSYIVPGSDGGNAGAGTDSSILFVLATTGLVGIGLFSLGYLSAIARHSSKWRTGGLIPAVVLLSLLFESNFINSLFYPQLLFLWLILAHLETS